MLSPHAPGEHTDVVTEKPTPAPRGPVRYDAFPLRGDGDRLSVQRLWREVLGDPRIRTAIAPRWKWQTEGNPAGPAHMCVVENRATGEVVGSAGALPRVVWIDGEPVPAAVLCDFAVDPHHRVAGAAVALQRALAKACFDGGIDLLYGFPNDGAFPIFARVGYRTVGEATMRFRPLRSAHKLAEHLPSPIARAAGFVVDRALAAYDLQLALRAGRGLADGLREQPGDDFLDLWLEGRARPGITGERTPAYLGWRYAQHPIEDCALFCVSEASSDRLLGYVAYCAPLGKVNVLDAFWRSPGALRPLWTRFIRRMRALGHASISVCHAGHPAIDDALRRLAFLRSKRRRKLVCKLAAHRQATLGAAALDLSRWSLFDGELDI